MPSPGKGEIASCPGQGFDERSIRQLQLRDEIVTLKLQVILGDLILGYHDDHSIVDAVAELLIENGKTLAVAESCTGGYLTSMLTEKPGASKFFAGSLVAYTEAMKIKELGVKEKTIHEFSVVSNQVAEEMAVGMLKKTGADFAVSTTGNAGPTTDNTDKKVGVVCIAIAAFSGVYSEEFNFGKPREKVIHRSSNKALELLRKKIIKNI